MKEKIFIGGEKRKLPCVSIHRYGDSGVADNDMIYRFECKLLNTEICIFKDSEEGRLFKEWINNEQNQTRQRVEHKGIELLLPLMSVDDLLEVISDIKESAWDDGYKTAQYDIRKALGF